ncbi:conserved hypothetical protein [Ricinus communis]|uniref:Uncharacterized protein n=1 Tax=Ricinus communis TaxID=3988 RepID=B9SB89_RICCO|nr:conserved hypothetical protein [Ricinus communis]
MMRKIKEVTSKRVILKALVARQKPPRTNECYILELLRSWVLPDRSSSQGAHLEMETKQN